MYITGLCLPQKSCLRMCLLVCDKCYLCFLLRNQVSLRGLPSSPAPCCEELSAALSGEALCNFTVALSWVIFYLKQQLHCLILYSCSLSKEKSAELYFPLLRRHGENACWTPSRNAVEWSVVQRLREVSVKLVVFSLSHLVTTWFGKKLKTRQEEKIFHQTNLVL